MTEQNSYPAQRMDSFEVQPEHFKNFVGSLRKFIEQENLPCKENLKKALEHIAFDKVQSNFIVFPQGSKLVLSQLGRMFGKPHQYGQ